MRWRAHTPRDANRASARGRKAASSQRAEAHGAMRHEVRKLAIRASAIARRPNSTRTPSRPPRASAPPHQHAQELTMYNDSKHGFDAVKTEYEAFMLEPHDWVPNNRKLPVVIYRHALSPHTGDLAAAF